MIKVRRSGKYAINFYFKATDKIDIEKMINGFKLALTSEVTAKCLVIKVERRMFARNRKSDYERMNLFAKLGTGNIVIYNNKFILELDKNDLEYGIDLLEEYIKLGYLKVAEFAKVSKPGCKWSDVG